MIVEVKVDANGDYIIEFPDELMKEVGWEIGDTLIWEETYICGNGEREDSVGYTLRKK